MRWIWQQDDWPNFRWDRAALEPLEVQFMRQSGVMLGVTRHLNEVDEMLLVIDLISNEAVKTSEIEGEILDRDSVQSSLRRHFGLAADRRRVSPAERGIADMMMDIYRNFSEPLTHETLFRWHAMLMSGHPGSSEVGQYRTHADPMQVVSGPLHNPVVHYEAPPSKAIPDEMNAFEAWFRQTAPGGGQPLPALARAGLAHLYFVYIHPFQDGNGRIARALAEKALSEAVGAPTLIALSQTIESRRKEYYAQLERHNKGLEITGWLVYFAETILAAQQRSLAMVEFLIAKTKLYDKFRDRLNERQKRVIDRLFRAGPGGFEGGLSAKNYISITGAPRATATRDLQELVELGVLRKTGELKSTRYYLNLKLYFGAI